MKGRGIARRVGAFERVSTSQVPEEVLARIRSDNARDRSDGVGELAKLQNPSASTLQVLADVLFEEAAEVRVAAAYGLARVAVALGCKAEKLDQCALFADVLDATPKAIKKANPVYPDEARRSRTQGTVAMECLVREDGATTNIRVVGGQSAIRGPAVDALRRWRYEPARRHGKAVPFALVFATTFKLS